MRGGSKICEMLGREARRCCYQFTFLWMFFSSPASFGRSTTTLSRLPVVVADVVVAVVVARLLTYSSRSPPLLLLLLLT